MSDILVDTSKASMVHAIEANLFAFFPQLSAWSRAEVYDEPEYLWTVSDLPFPLFNSVLRARVNDRIDERIDHRMATCRERDVPLLWWTGPSSQPSDLDRRLAARGFLVEPARGMAADLEKTGTARPRACAATVDPVGDLATLRAWCGVLCSAFGASPDFGVAFEELALTIGLDPPSPFRHFLARADGAAVATCSLFLGAGVAGIYDVSTVPGFRRRGLGAMVTTRAMAEARQLGYRVAILHSSPLGVGVYRSLGFQDLCAIGQYVWVPPGWTVES
jgi:GNAT superfamily N-acetyltransferase